MGGEGEHQGGGTPPDRTRATPLVAAVLLAVLTLLFWKLRIVDSGDVTALDLSSVDLYIHHYPMSRYGFAALAAGRIPLWNPYQLCGQPYLAIPYPGIFYPGNLPYLLLDTARAIEVDFLVHMLLGGLAAWALGRALGAGTLGGLAAAVTFMWSGWVVMNADEPSLFAALAWMPAILLALERVLAGRAWAWLGLVLAVACATLVGVTEILLHTFYVGAWFSLCRLAGLARDGAWRTAAVRAAAIVGACGAGVALAAFQLLPSVELARLSARRPGVLDFGQALALGVIPARGFVIGTLATSGLVTVGVLPLFALPLVLGWRRHAAAWVFAAVAALVAALLVFGGPVFRLYHALPMGGWFRRPMKFLDVYVLAQAILAGLAVARLESWRTLARHGLWRHPAWLACLALAAAVVWWPAAAGWPGAPNPWLAAGAALLVAFGLARPGWGRGALVVALCALQGANLFLAGGSRTARPSARPGVFDAQQELFAFLAARVGHERIFVSPTFRFAPGLTAKQGMLRGLRITSDYDALSVGRYAAFFRRVARDPNTARPWDGAYRLDADSAFGLMDLTATRYYVVRRDDDVARHMRRATDRFELLRDGPIAVFARRDALPRAHLVGGARVVEAGAVLAALEAPEFDPRAEVILEDPGAPRGTPGAAPPEATVTITRDGAERVDVVVDSPRAGFLVLADLDYPGWRALVDGSEVPIHRANYLFRSVWLEAGRHRVRFEYRPASFRAGLALSALALLSVAAAAAVVARRRGMPTAALPPRAA